MEFLTRYWGTDWAGMILGLISAFYLGKQKKRGFLFATLGSVSWIAFGFLSSSLPSVAANVIFVVLNIKGWRQWKNNPKKC